VRLFFPGSGPAVDPSRIQTACKVEDADLLALLAQDVGGAKKDKKKKKKKVRA
jgi:hypothetical protein